jgi:hypothetical protein
MIEKVNFSIKLKIEKNIYKIKLFDVDLFKDDLLKKYPLQILAVMNFYSPWVTQENFGQNYK